MSGLPVRQQQSSDSILIPAAVRVSGAGEHEHKMYQIGTAHYRGHYKAKATKPLALCDCGIV